MQWRASTRLHAVPSITAAELVPEGGRAVIVAPHPDDEIMGCGGLLAELQAAGKQALLVAASDGEASHPGSAFWTPERLRYERPRETTLALRDLGARNVEVVRAHLPDGALASAQTRLAAMLHHQVGAGDVLFCTWRNDGHPDHEAVGRATAAVAKTLQLPLVEYPVWAWHWAKPEDEALPWQRARRLKLGAQSIRGKLRALGRFRSQVQADDTNGSDPVLTPATLLRTVQVGEVFFT